MLTRRQCLTNISTLSLGGALPFSGRAQATDAAALKAGYAQRMKKILATGTLPYIDLESSCNSTQVDIDFVAQNMDRLGIGLMALSADVGHDEFKKGVRFDALSDRLVAAYPDRFIPIGNGGQPPLLTEAPEEFLSAQRKALDERRIMGLGEYEFRHYPSPRQVRRDEGEDRDVQVPIDGPTGQALFRMSEETGAFFQLHYEIEDALLVPLEKMLTQYPKARVVWCHIAQVRYAERAGRYNAAYVDGLIRRFPNLYFDTAFGNWKSVYPLSGQHQSRIWANKNALVPEWRDLIAAHPTRFLSSLDLGQDRLDRMAEYDQRHRHFLSLLPGEVQHSVAYRNAWRLLFGEEFA